MFCIGFIVGGFLGAIVALLIMACMHAGGDEK